MDNYKGIYYHDSKEQRFYEGGAHFKYDALFKVLLAIGGQLSNDENEYSPISPFKKCQIKSNKDIDSLLRKVEGKKSRYKTRNIVPFDYLNNPNTQINLHSHKSILHKTAFLTKKDFSSRNIKNDNSFLFDKNNLNTDKNISSLSINNLNKNNMSKNLVNILLNRKENVFKKVEEKTNKYNILNFTKYIHHRNKSEFYENRNNSTAKNNSISKNNIINSIRKIVIVNEPFNKKKDEKMQINKSCINNDFKDNNQETSAIKGDDKDNNNNNNNDNNNNNNNNNNDNNIIINNNNDNNNNINNINNVKNLFVKIKEKKYPLIYGKSKLFIQKDGLKLNNRSSFHKKNNVKKSRNVLNTNIIGYSNIYENNKTSNDINKNSYKKKFVKKYLFCSTENKKDNSYINKNDMNKNIISNYNNNLSPIGNNIFKSHNIKNKEKILRTNGNDLILKKYIRKKINQLCVFNNNNGKIKNGKALNKLDKINSNILFN
jgi:hypothetical protein